jgi:signal peptidase I
MTRTGETNSNAVFCRGESMRPLFRPGDRIEFVPCRIEKLRCGDVIIFVPPEKQERVVHRVVSKGPEGIRTQGDANPRLDAGELRQEDIVGRAVSVERNGKVLPVKGGIAGRLLSAVIRAFRRCDHLAAHVLNPCYRGLARSGHFRALLPPSLRPRVIMYDRDGQREMQLVLGRRIIGRRPAGADSWTIRRPFRIFVDEQALP